MSQARTLNPIRRITKRDRATEPAQLDLSELKPLPTWFFAFEGVMAASFDLVKINPNLLLVLGGLVVVNVLVSLTVMRRRIKLARAMLRNRRTRSIAIGLIGLRMGAHVVLNAAGAAITTPAMHAAMAVLMGGITVALLRFDQAVSFRALAAGRTAAPAVAPAIAPVVAQV
jgi:hypothetical protein